MERDRENFSDRDDTEDAIAALRNRHSRAQGVQPIEHKEAKHRLRKAAAESAARS